MIKRFGPRWIAGVGSVIALCATLPFAWPALSIPVALMAVLLFIRGFGIGYITMPAIVSAYADLPKAVVPDAATAMNIVQRLGGPVATMALALLLQAQAYQDAGAVAGPAASSGFGPYAFAIAFAGALRFPRRLYSCFEAAGETHRVACHSVVRTGDSPFSSGFREFFAMQA